MDLRGLVTGLAASARNAGMKFIVLRSYEGLPSSAVGRDLDLLVAPGSMSTWVSLLKSFCRTHGLRYQAGWRYLYCRSQFIWGLEGRDYIQIDLEPNLNWRGVDFLVPGDVIGDARRFCGDIWIPHPAHECIISFCMSYLHGGFVKSKYVNAMGDFARQYPVAVGRRLTRVFGEDAGQRILDAMIRGDFGDVSRAATANRIRALWRGLLRHPVRFAYSFVVGYLLEFWIKIAGRKLPEGWSTHRQ